MQMNLEGLEFKESHVWYCFSKMYLMILLKWNIKVPKLCKNPFVNTYSQSRETYGRNSSLKKTDLNYQRLFLKINTYL